MHTNEIRLTAIALLMSVALVASLAAPSPAQAADTDKSSKEKLVDSLKVWLKSKADAGGNYTYQVSRSSFTGARRVTTIMVRDHKIVERRFEVFGGRPQLIRPGEKPKKQAPKWIERGKDIGKHKEAAAPKTIDQLYAQAKMVLETQLNPHQKL